MAHATIDRHDGPMDVLAPDASPSPVQPEWGQDDDAFDVLFGHTVVRTVEAAAVRPSQRGAAVADRPARDHDGGSGMVLVFSSGTRVVVDQSVVIGRRPCRLDPHDPSGRLVAVSDPTVSRLHAVVRLDDRRATIEDLGSSNGTTVVAVGRSVRSVRAGRPVLVDVGAVVTLGGVSFAMEALA